MRSILMQFTVGAIVFVTLLALHLLLHQGINLVWGASFSSLGFLLTTSLLSPKPKGSARRALIVPSIFLKTVTLISFHASIRMLNGQNSFVLYAACYSALFSLFLKRSVALLNLGLLACCVTFQVLSLDKSLKEVWLAFPCIIVMCVGYALLGRIDGQSWNRRDSLLPVAFMATLGALYTYKLGHIGNSSPLIPLALFTLGSLGSIAFLKGNFNSLLSLPGILGAGSICIGSLFLFPVAGNPLFAVLSAIPLFVVTRRIRNNDTKFNGLTENDLLLNNNKTQQHLYTSIMSNSRERKLLIFLLLTIVVMVLEFAYGMSVNSLGLVSDSFHMMLDSASIAIGLYAAHASTWQPDERTHPFGFGRYEVLGGFVNGILLLFIALYVMMESIERILDPPIIEATYLLLVSVIGLIVNIIGVVFFHDSHGHSHSHGHGHDCGGSGSHSHGKHVDHNMRGVYLHILADLLGSVSVIVSSGFIYLFNFWIADPICSGLSATLILLSAFPLLEETGKILLLSAPDTTANVSEALHKSIGKLDFVKDLDVPKVWMHSTAPRELLMCVVSAKLKKSEDYSASQKVIRQVINGVLEEHIEAEKTNVFLHLE